VLQNAALLKEAQIMSQQLDKHVVFQFCVIDIGHTFGSSYDAILTADANEDDEDLGLAPKPCIGVRVVDFKHDVVFLWSLKKLRKRVRQMRQLHQYLHSPQYAQHFDLGNPFSEACLPQYSRIGDVDVPLSAVFEARVQDFALDVMNPFTSNVIGIVKLSLEPSFAEAPESTLKFNVVMHEFVGFPEREGTAVHAQLFIPGISDEEGGVTTTSLGADFDEGPVRFESVHSMSLPMDSPRTASLRISMFARVTAMHLDKLLSWDDMRDSATRVRDKKRKKSSRIPESEYYSEEKHDIFTRLQVQEISERGEYEPVEVVQSGALDTGAFQLHQGLQRRIVISMTHSSAQSLQWQDVTGLRVGRVVLLDNGGKASDLDTPQPEVPLKMVGQVTVQDNADGTSDVRAICQWDSSMHSSPLLDRATSDRHRVQIAVLWNVVCGKLTSPMQFSMDLGVQIRARNYVRQAGVLSQLWNPVRVVHSTVGMFAVAIRPVSAKRAADLWRMDSKNDYVKGEEALSGWTPRGVSLVQDFIQARKQKRKVCEVETAKSVLGMRVLALPTTNGASYTENTEDAALSDEQSTLLRRVLTLWTTKQGIEEALLSSSNTSPPRKGAAFANGGSTSTTNGTTTNGTSPHTSPRRRRIKPTLIPSVRFIPKNPSLMKGGYLLTPDPSQTRWIRRYVELRRPYLHVYSVPEGDELNAINLTHARIDHDPQLAMLLQRDNVGAVWAVFGTQNSWIFKARSERDKVEWILKVDESYFSSPSGSGSGDEDGGVYRR
jgi:kinesin family protein 1